MAKKPTNKKNKEKDKRSMKAPAIAHRSKDYFYRKAGFKNSNIVLGHDALEKLAVISSEMFSVSLNIEKVKKEDTGFILSTLINMVYNKLKDETHAKIEPALNIEAMRLYHYHQAISYMNESRASITPLKERRYKWIRNRLDDGLTTDKIMDSSHRCSKDENWNDEAIEFMLNTNFVNTEIKRANKKI